MKQDTDLDDTRRLGGAQILALSKSLDEVENLAEHQAIMTYDSIPTYQYQ